MDATDDHLRTFDALRPRLMGLAYRMTGTMADAEDIVQEAWLRWHRVHAHDVERPDAYLFRVVSRLCVDCARSAQVRREIYVGPWLPEPVVDHAALGLDTEPPDAAELANDISVALLLVLDRLSPVERAVFLLHDVFDYTFAEIAPMVERTPATCRKLGSRARQRVRADYPTGPLPRAAANDFVVRFLQILQSGDVAAIAQTLAEDARLVADGGGKVYAALNPIDGRDHIMRFFTGLIRKFGAPRSVVLAWLNGRPALVFQEPEGAFQAWSIDWTRAGQARTIHLVRNPDKLVGVSSMLADKRIAPPEVMAADSQNRCD